MNKTNNEVNVRMSFITIPHDSKYAAKEFITEQIHDVINKSSNHDLIQIVFFFTRKLKSRIKNLDVFLRKILHKVPDEIQIILFTEHLPLNYENGLPSDYVDKMVKKYKGLNDEYFKQSKT